MSPSRPLPHDDLQAIAADAKTAFSSLAGARLFITGGTGFFGHWLLESVLAANRLQGAGIRVTALTRDAARFRTQSPHIASDPAITLLEGDIRNFRFPAEPHTHVLHAATDAGAARPGAPAYELAESILEGTRHVLRFALQTGATRMLYVSSGAVYGRNITGVECIREDFRGGPDPLALVSSYDEAKRMAEHLCVAYSDGTALEVSVARAFAFIGPHLPLDAHFAIGNFMRDALAGRTIQIGGDGTPLRSFLYMRDLATWLWVLLVRGRRQRAYNVGSDEAVSIAELAMTVAQTLRGPAAANNSAVHIAKSAEPGALASTYVPCITRAEDELGLRVSVPLREAIRRTAAWHGYPLP